MYKCSDLLLRHANCSTGDANYHLPIKVSHATQYFLLYYSVSINFAADTVGIIITKSNPFIILDNSILFTANF